MEVITFWQENKPNGNKWCQLSNGDVIPINEKQITELWEQWAVLPNCVKFHRRNRTYFYLNGKTLTLKGGNDDKIQR